MLDPSNFVYLKSGDSESLPEATTLLRYRERLEKMRALFLYEKSAREITQTNLSLLERELLDMVGGIDRLRVVPGIKKLLPSPDAAQAEMKCVITCFNLASDLLEMPRTPKRRELLYQKYGEIPEHLSQAIQLLKPKS